MLPGPTFVKTFLRTYAEMLGLDPHVLVEEYRANYERGTSWRLQPLGPAAALAAGPPPARAAAGPGIAIALLVLVAVVGVLVVHRAVERRRQRGGGGGQAARTETTHPADEPRSPRSEKPAPPKPA